MNKDITPQEYIDFSRNERRAETLDLYKAMPKEWQDEVNRLIIAENDKIPRGDHPPDDLD